MADILSIAIAVIAIYFIMKIAFKLLKVFLIIAVIVALAYVLTNYGFLGGLF
jgi:predicted permease